MIDIEEKELEQVQGGGISWGIVAGIVAGVTFLIGLIEGYVNPNKCNG